jgi:hypothetical protein
LTLFGVIMALQITAFNPDYIASYVDEADISSIVTTWLNENVAPDRPVLARAAALGANYFEPQIKEQLHSAVRTAYTFLLNRLDQGRLLETIQSQRPLINDVATNTQAVLNIPALQSLFTNLGIDSSKIASSIDVNQINSFFDLIERAARFQSLLAFVKNFYIPLIVILIALIVGIIFVGRRFRFIFIVLGITLAVYGVVQLSSLLPFGNLARSAIANLSLSSLATDTATKFINDVIRPINIFSAIMLFCGLVLMVMYFVTRPRRAAV